MIEKLIDRYKFSYIFDDLSELIFNYPLTHWFSNNKDIQYNIFNHLLTSSDKDSAYIRHSCDLRFGRGPLKYPTGSSFCYDLVSDTVRSEIITKSGRKITPEDIYKMKPLLERNTHHTQVFFATNISIGLMLYLIYIICKFIFSHYSTRRRLQPNPRVVEVMDGRRKKRRIKSVDKKSRYKSKRRLKSIRKRRRSKKC